MAGGFTVRTDLALENQESFHQKHVEVRGVVVEKYTKEDAEIQTTMVKIETENGARAMGKPIGTYITLESPNLSMPEETHLQEIAQALAMEIRKLLPAQKDMEIMVVGLGNHNVTPDALGPMVVENLKMSRHIVREYGRESMENPHMTLMSGLIPGVMAQTGMESLEIIRGVVQETKPDAVIVIDALAARSMKRLSRTIQVTDTGINPGSGVGNHRNGIHEDSLGVPVIGIGVPTVVDAATIVHDALEHMLQVLEEKERAEFLDELLSPGLHTMFVTPKDVDEVIARVSLVLANAIKLALTV
jgi:spore protease